MNIKMKAAALSAGLVLGISGTIVAAAPRANAGVVPNFMKCTPPPAGATRRTRRSTTACPTGASGTTPSITCGAACGTPDVIPGAPTSTEACSHREW